MAKQVVAITELPEENRPVECFPCNYAYRSTDATMALVETEHPDYQDGVRVTGLCGNHAETIDLDSLRNT